MVRPPFQTIKKAAPETGPSPRPRRASGQECGKPAGSYIKSNQTENSHLDLSILPSVPPGESGWIDRYDCEKEIEINIEYDRLCRQFACEDVDEIVALIVDTLCATRPTIRIGGDGFGKRRSTDFSLGLP